MRPKRDEQVANLSVGLTDAEIEKIRLLMEHFKKKYIHEVFVELVKVIPQIEKTKITTSVKSLGDNFKIRTLRLNNETYSIIEQYSIDHFREKNNTIRYFINAGYEIFIKE